MALFLVRQAADHGITIPAAAAQGYTDIGGLPQATQDAINQVTQLGISKGTSTYHVLSERWGDPLADGSVPSASGWFGRSDGDR